MSIRTRMRQALPDAMRARDKVAVSALRATLAALDNAEAVPSDAAGPGALELSPVGAGATEAPRHELTERDVAELVRAEAEERLDAARQLAGPAHQEHVARLRAEAQVLLGFLEDGGDSASLTGRQ